MQLVVPLVAVVVPLTTVFATASDLMNFIYKYLVNTILVDIK